MSDSNVYEYALHSKSVHQNSVTEQALSVKASHLEGREVWDQKEKTDRLKMF